jgi:hypothetical protein
MFEDSLVDINMNNNCIKELLIVETEAVGLLWCGVYIVERTLWCGLGILESTV